MSYATLAVVLLAVSTAVALAGARRLPPGGPRRRHWQGVGAAAAVLVVLTAVFDNLMIAAGLFEYDLAGTLGIAIGRAPIEDFSYPIACALGVPGLWLLLSRREDGVRD